MNTQNAANVSHRPSRLQNFVREVQFALAALEIGSRTVALADNRQLVRDLAARAASLYPADQR